MGVCWYCHWGWSKEVAAIYDRAVADIERLNEEDDPWPPYEAESALHYGPAHIVWADENFYRDSVQWCLDHFDEYRRDMPDPVAAIVRRSLVELLALPDAVLDPEPADYDDEHPENYPPAVEMGDKPGWR
jgi:hypothetical protein